MFLFCFMNLIIFVVAKNSDKGKVPTFVGFGGKTIPVTPEYLNWHIGQMMPMMYAFPFQPTYTNPLMLNQDVLESITRNPNIRDLIKKTDRNGYERRQNYDISSEKGISEHKKEIKALLEEFISKYRAIKMKKYKKINQKDSNMETYFNYKTKERKEQKDLSREVDLLREDLIEDYKNREDSSSQEEEEKEETENMFEINNQSNGKANNIQKPRIVFIRNPQLAPNVTNNNI